MNKYKISIEYQGTPFSGWQKQQDRLTIQGVIEDAIFKFSAEEVTLYGAGRTDSKVHALGQVASFELSRNFEIKSIKGALNYYLKPYPVVVYDVEKLEEGSDFHARFSAKKRSYIYKILQREYPPSFEKNLVWWVATPLNVDIMNKAASLLIGNHDFSSFRASGCQANSPIKTVDKAYFKADGQYLVFYIEAKSFLYHQVRNIVGSLYDVGRGYISLEEFEEIFNSCDRTKAGVMAPAEGLYFYRVEY